MNEKTNRDAAWVSVENPLTLHELRTFITDLERLYRINSLLEVNRWHAESTSSIQVDLNNLSNGKSLCTNITMEQRADGLLIRYLDGLKTSTHLKMEENANGSSRLTITDDYSAIPEGQRRERLDEVDRSLPQWGQDLHSYLRSWKRWSWLPPWRWYMGAVWLPMKPSARRITRWIFWITAAEMVVFLFVLQTS